MPQTPKWAESLTHEVCHDFGKPYPRIQWRSYNRGFSSGTAYDDHIVICAGKRRRDQRLVLLHELAHWVSPKGDHHSIGFWATAFDLYRRYGVPIRYAQRREYRYKLRAKQGYELSLKRKRTAPYRDGSLASQKI